MASHNRRDVVLDTLAKLHLITEHAPSCEIIVVDNASSDGTVSAIASRYPGVRILARPDNRGSCAKAFGVEEARGEFILFLDDDSYPDAPSVTRMVEHFRQDATLGAAGFTIHLPDGRRECGALPHVFVGCGVGFRADALCAVGGLDLDFFMQAEEYDLSFRLAASGWKVRVFGDLHVHHHKTARARISARTTYYDTRNNLIVARRYLPAPFRSVYTADWSQRYRWLATANGHARQYWKGRMAATVRALQNRSTNADSQLNADDFEQFFRLDDVRRRMIKLKTNGIRRIVLADLGKNIYAFYAGARETGLSILGIADDWFHRTGRQYRGIPIVPTSAISRLNPDAIIISNMAAAHAGQTQKKLAREWRMPIEHWFREPPLTYLPQFESTEPPKPADTPSTVAPPERAERSERIVARAAAP